MRHTRNILATNPIDKSHEVQQTSDKHITQDFENYPANPAKENIIKPETKADRLTAKTETRDKNRGDNPVKNKKTTPGDTTGAEKKVARDLNKKGGPAISNKAKRLKKQGK